jgi:hypothetical protein
MVVHICNPSYLGGKDWEDFSLKKSVKSPLNKNPGVVVHICNSSSVEGRGRIAD